MDVHELTRHAAPGGRPQTLAFHDGALWIGSRETSRLYAVDAASWTVVEDVPLPGEPFGLTSFDGALHVVVSIGEDDDRHLYRFVPADGFAKASRMECPDRTGSNLASDGKSLFLVQATFQRIVEQDAAGIVKRTIALPSRTAGICYGPHGFSFVAADAEFDVLEFGSLDLSGHAAVFTKRADISPEARGLAYDGRAWWTNLRELNEVVSFDA